VVREYRWERRWLAALWWEPLLVCPLLGQGMGSEEGGRTLRCLHLRLRRRDYRSNQRGEKGSPPRRTALFRLLQRRQAESREGRR